MEERDAENKKDTGNKGSDENRRYIDIYSVIFFVLIPIIIIGILTVKTVYVYKTISLIDNIDGDLLCKFLEDSHWVDLGISILGIAVSVWLGINISNLVDKRQIDKLNKKIEESKIRIKDMENSITKLNEDLADKQKTLEDKISNANVNIENEFYKTKLLDVLSRTINLYEASKYLFDLFNNSNCDINYKELLTIETEFWNCISAYENTKWNETYTYSRNGLELLESFGYAPVDYYEIRKSDFIFYKNIALTHDSKLGSFSSDELKFSIKLYENILESIEKNNKLDELSDFVGYIYNTIGYTYDILNIYGDKDNRDLYSALAIFNMKSSVKYNKKGRYFRNLGLTYQHRGELKEAKDCYKIAFEKDTKDYKAFNNRLAIILRQIDKILKVNDRFDNGILLSDLNGMGDLECKELMAELKEIINYREFAEMANCWFEDIQFNLCKAYMYFYIFSGYKNRKYMELSVDYGKKSLFLNGNSIGAKFCLRNAYECWGKLTEAKQYNEDLKNRNIGDSVKADKVYCKCLEGDN